MSVQTHGSFASATSGRGSATALDQSLNRMQPDDLGPAWVAARGGRQLAGAEIPQAAGARRGAGGKASDRQSAARSPGAPGGGSAPSDRSARDATEPHSDAAAGSPRASA